MPCGRAAELMPRGGAAELMPCGGAANWGPAADLPQDRLAGPRGSDTAAASATPTAPHWLADDGFQPQRQTNDRHRRCRSIGENRILGWLRDTRGRCQLVRRGRRDVRLGAA